MKGLVFLGDRKLGLHEYPDVEAGPGEVKVRVVRAAVCGTDVHKYRLAPEKIARRPDGSPEVPGHEPAGVVESVGSGVEGLSVGARVLLAGVFGCGLCRLCRAGFNTACERGVCGFGWNHHGADATHLVVPLRNVVELPQDVSFDAASVLTCAGGTAYTVVRETALGCEDTLAILGLGPVGLSLAVLAKAAGVRCIGIDRSAFRLAQAEAVGIDARVDASREDPIAAVKRWSGGGCSVVAECVGAALTQAQALDMARVRGRVALAGLGSEAVSLDLTSLFIGRQLRAIGIAATPIAYFSELVRHTSERRLDFASLVTHHYPFEAAAEAFATMESGNSGKVLFDVSASD
jgi:(R,R)-butanediol dehydrogenase / meso-butanediol dehydrogenase / diacetyl reductase